MKFVKVAGVRWSMLVSVILWHFSKKHTKELLFWMVYREGALCHDLIYLWRNLLPLEYIKQYARSRAEITVCQLREQQEFDDETLA